MSSTVSYANDSRSYSCGMLALENFHLLLLLEQDIVF